MRSCRVVGYHSLLCRTCRCDLVATPENSAPRDEELEVSEAELARTHQLAGEVHRLLLDEAVLSRLDEDVLGDVVHLQTLDLVDLDRVRGLEVVVDVNTTQVSRLDHVDTHVEIVENGDGH